MIQRDPKRCFELVMSSFHEAQCSRRGVIDRDGILYCKQHDPVARKAKRDAEEAKWRAVQNARRAVEAAGIALRLARDEVINQARIIAHDDTIDITSTHLTVAVQEFEKAEEAYTKAVAALRAVEAEREGK